MRFLVVFDKTTLVRGQTGVRARIFEEYDAAKKFFRSLSRQRKHIAIYEGDDDVWKLKEKV